MPTEQELEKAHNEGFNDADIAVYDNYYEHPELQDAYNEGWDERWEEMCTQ